MFVLKGTVRAPSMTMHSVPTLITFLQRLFVHFANRLFVHLHFFCTFQICDWVKQACSARMAWKSFYRLVARVRTDAWYLSQQRQSGFASHILLWSVFIEVLNPYRWVREEHWTECAYREPGVHSLRNQNMCTIEQYWLQH